MMPLDYLNVPLTSALNSVYAARAQVITIYTNVIQSDVYYQNVETKKNLALSQAGVSES